MKTLKPISRWNNSTRIQFNSSTSFSKFKNIGTAQPGVLQDMQQQNITIWTYKPIMTLEHPYLYILEMEWVRSRYLPRQYRNYDLYNGYKVVLNGYHGHRPYAHI
jgi:hypothetical protein